MVKAVSIFRREIMFYLILFLKRSDQVTVPPLPQDLESHPSTLEDMIVWFLVYFHLSPFPFGHTASFWGFCTLFCQTVGTQ